MNAVTEQRTIFITEQDYERLRRHLDAAADPDQYAALEEELERADIVAPHEVPPDVVTMNSSLLFEDEESGERREVTLVYPRDADAEHGKVSVLAPVGSALLGLSVGQSIAWPLPGGRSKRLRIVDITYQPEASGDFHR